MYNNDTVISVNAISKTFIKNRTVQNSLREEVMQFLKTGKKRLEEQFLALDKISFEVKKGEVLGIIGPNGAGKSTLLKVLSNITVPDSGEARIHGRVSSLLEVGTGFHRELSGRENIYLNGMILGMTREEIKTQEDEIIEFSGVKDYIDTPIKHFSSGMGVRLAFSVAAHLNAEILLIDEVLAVGDAAFQAKCLDKMKNISSTGRTVLFVSHQLNVVQQLCTRSLLLDKGKVLMDGPSKNVIAKYLEDVSIKNEFIPTSGPIKNISAKQDQNKIIINGNYEVTQTVKIPSLGFVIYNSFGQPITGSNPIIAGIDTTQTKYESKGRVNIELTSPILLDGMYFLSVWFGVDGYSNLVHYDKCISFQVAGMSADIRKSNTKELGSAASICQYYFT